VGRDGIGGIVAHDDRWTATTTAVTSELPTHGRLQVLGFSKVPFVKRMTGRTFLAMLVFAGMVAAVMWFLVLPAGANIRPSLP
jgi:hypothetical protein